MSRRFFQSQLTGRALAVVAIVLMSLSQVRAQDLDEAVDAELDSATNIDAAADLDAAPATPKVKTGDAELDDIDLDAADNTKQATSSPTPAPAPEATDNKGGDELTLDEPSGGEKAPEPTLDEPTAPPPVVDEPPLDLQPETQPEKTPEPPPAIAKEPEPNLFDPPNTAYEKKLHQIVESVKATDDFSWDDMIGERRAEIYKVQAGDTLWDISETFFGDGFFWGKLWSENGTIENPHNISKGYALRFAAGTEADAPVVGVAKLSDVKTVGNGIFARTSNDKPAYREDVQGEITQDEVESGTVIESQEIIPAPTLPPPSKRIPLLKSLPASFKIDHPEEITEGFDSSGIKGAPAIRAREAATVVLPSFAVDSEPDALGKVDEIEVADRFASTGQFVIVRLNRDIDIGKKVTFASLRSRPSGAPGPIVDVQGTGTITGVVNENKNAYRALVMTTLHPVEKGAMVLDEPPPIATYSKDGPRGEADVRVLGANFDNGRILIGDSSVVYLSGGKKAGLHPGEILGVLSRRESRHEDTRYPNATHPIGTIKVIDVRERVATAIVLENGEYITVGDRTGGELPEARPPIVTETAQEATNFNKKQESDEKPAKSEF